MVLVCITRLTNMIIASTSMATVRSIITVRKKVISNTAISAQSPLSRYLKVLHSLMLYATITSMAARAESGM